MMSQGRPRVFGIYKRVTSIGSAGANDVVIASEELRVMGREDALSAIGAGADGIVVSTHGGRQLDGVASCISKLPGIVDAAQGETEVYMDGGVRNGADVIKAVALGARAVLIGRPWAWALSARGQQGVQDLLGVIHREIEISMALMGVNSIDELTSELVER